MIRRPPRSTLFPLHDALPISDYLYLGIQPKSKLPNLVFIALSRFEDLSEHIFVFFGVEFLDPSFLKDKLKIGYETSLQGSRSIEHNSASSASFDRWHFDFS